MPDETQRPDGPERRVSDDDLSLIEAGTKLPLGDDWPDGTFNLFERFDSSAGRPVWPDGIVAALVADLRDARASLSAVDSLLARRDALDDLAGRCDKIARLLRVASEKDPKGIIPEAERDKATITALKVERDALIGIGPGENAGSFESCTDCGRRMVWDRKPGEQGAGSSWMCPRCVLERLKNAERELIALRLREKALVAALKRYAKDDDCGDCVRGMVEGQNDPDQPRYCDCRAGQARAALSASEGRET